MKTRRTILVLLTLLFVVRAGAAEDAKPNILFIAIDDLRPELGCYGDTVVKSPHIDKLAAESMVFDRAYCSVAVCGASRASLMTGILPTKNRYIDFLAKVDEDTPNAVTMPQVFKDAGYFTKANGKVFHTATDTAERSWSRPARRVGDADSEESESAAPAARKKGGKGAKLFFDDADVPDNAYGDGIVAEQTIADLRELKESGKPFFLACGFIRPHLPFIAPKKYWDLYDEATLPIADNRFKPEDAPDALHGSGEFKTYSLGKFRPASEAFHRKMRHGYFASTSYSDKLTGDVLNELERLGLAENTIVILWGDHGWHLGEHNFWGKHNTMHNALRIPLIVKVPGKMQGKSGSLIQSVDIFPTLCSLAGLEVPKSVQGHSFVELLSAPDKKINEAVYARFKEADAVVTDQFTYSRYSNGEEMMYDLQKDPKENRNIVGNPEYASTLKFMREELHRRIKLAESAAF
ncbi:sulfatase [Novipirellula artificiosorum]|uniref:Arylsulfatase n=1 Tax=Novipirellula artificiosorum TaxID=2528016 RepID=A0A5C6DD84_9BACT|nr:sulfatase [Novipirellula artificiosorum]TWU33186.1 Arylsulfatase [Novipirellula artificiosorum]